MNVVLRPATRDDASACGHICYEAFSSVAQSHNFPSDWRSPDDATAAITALLSHPGFYGVVAEQDSSVVGSCFLDERSTVVGLGPITVNPTLQASSIGRRLIEHSLERVDQHGKDGVRLVQAAYNNQSLALYVKLGFEVREPLANMQGVPIGQQLPGYRVLPVPENEIDLCNEICRHTHGYDRRRELEDAIATGTARLVEHDNQILGYTTAIGFRGHAVAETNEALKALIGVAGEFTGSGFLLPSRNGDVFRWCLSNGLRIVQQMTYMSLGMYKEPEGVFLPSILA
jgi:predicted N-acetyltransferase YhbS